MSNNVTDVYHMGHLQLTFLKNFKKNYHEVFLQSWSKLSQVAST